MSVSLPELRVGEPVRHEALSVFPLFSEANGQIEYRLADEALADESVTVEEVSESGSVPDLLVENASDSRVLFLEGEELVGAKQNRILNTSVLIPARSKLKIPVSCVEQRRWAYRSRKFGSSGSHSPSKLRRALKSSVSRSARAKRGHRSDQREVWSEVGHLHASHGVDSDTAAMSDAFDTLQDRLAEFRERLKYVEAATGLVVTVGGKIAVLDLFDKPATCQKVWDRLLSGPVFDALEAGQTDQQVELAEVERLLGLASDLHWEQVDAVGEGQEYRAESPRGDFASVLLLDEAVVHGSVVMGE